jgi:hypothetical protein
MRLIFFTVFEKGGNPKTRRDEKAIENASSTPNIAL